ncbi:MAG: hypothetical protein V3V01_17935, partial [Acidimicrobiales bacterium]
MSTWWFTGPSGFMIWTANVDARVGLKTSVKTQVDAGVSHVVGLRTSIGMEKDSAAAVAAPLGLSCSVVTGVTPPPLPIDPDSQSHIWLSGIANGSEIVLPSSAALDPTGDLEFRFTLRRRNPAPVGSGKWLLDRFNLDFSQFEIWIDNTEEWMIQTADSSGFPRGAVRLGPPTIDAGQWFQYRVTIEGDV